MKVKVEVEKLNNIINMVDLGYALFSVTWEESITQRTFRRNNQILGYKINVNKLNNDSDNILWSQCNRTKHEEN